MSGSGGYYKYRCKYFYTFNCPHWVWVNNAPCAHCLADGREADIAITQGMGSFRLPREVSVPHFENGSLRYIIMDIAEACEMQSGGIMKTLPVPAFPTSTGPEAVNMKSTSGEDNDGTTKGGFQHQAGYAWGRKSENF